MLSAVRRGVGADGAPSMNADYRELVIRGLADDSGPTPARRRALTREPAFLFYVNDWRSSRRVAAMTFAERGMYLEMLLEQWDTGSVPGSPAACAKVLGGSITEWK